MKKLHNLIHAQRISSARNEVRSTETITLFMGITKSGKSTIVNYMIGNRLTSAEYQGSIYLELLQPERIEPYRGDNRESAHNITNTLLMLIISTSMSLISVAINFVIRGILGNSPLSKTPKIGNTSQSETTHPESYHSLYNGTIYDLPGFEDNRGSVQDINNAFLIRSIINKYQSCKLVLVSDFHDIYGGEVSPFKTLLQKVHDLFPNISANLRGVSIIFTKYKIPLTPPPSYTDVIPHILISKFITTPFFADKPELQQLVEHFINNPQSIAVFEKPSESRKIYQIDKGDLIATTIANTSYIQTATLGYGLSISLKSKMDLTNLCDDYFVIFQSNILLFGLMKEEKIESIRKDQSQILDDPAESIEKLKLLKPDIETIRSEFDGPELNGIEELSNFLRRFCKVITIAKYNNDVMTFIENVKFVEQILETAPENSILSIYFIPQTNLMIQSVRNKLYSSETDLKIKARQKANTEQSEITKKLKSIVDIIIKQHVEVFYNEMKNCYQEVTRNNNLLVKIFNKKTITDTKDFAEKFKRSWDEFTKLSRELKFSMGNNEQNNLIKLENICHNFKKICDVQPRLCAQFSIAIENNINQSKIIYEEFAKCEEIDSSIKFNWDEINKAERTLITSIESHVADIEHFQAIGEVPEDCAIS